MRSREPRPSSPSHLDPKGVRSAFGTAARLATAARVAGEARRGEAIRFNNASRCARFAMPWFEPERFGVRPPSSTRPSEPVQQATPTARRSTTGGGGASGHGSQRGARRSRAGPSRHRRRDVERQSTTLRFLAVGDTRHESEPIASDRADSAYPRANRRHDPIREATTFAPSTVASHFAQPEKDPR